MLISLQLTGSSHSFFLAVGTTLPLLYWSLCSLPRFILNKHARARISEPAFLGLLGASYVKIFIPVVYCLTSSLVTNGLERTSLSSSDTSTSSRCFAKAEQKCLWESSAFPLSLLTVLHSPVWKGQLLVACLGISFVCTELQSCALYQPITSWCPLFSIPQVQSTKHKERSKSSAWQS